MTTEEILNSISIESVKKTTTRRNELGKEEFLRLLIEQMKNQDPLDPIKNEDFIAQLAQFNSLEQMINLNKSFSLFLAGQQLAQAGSFIGVPITALNSAGEEVAGVVSEVHIVDGVPKLLVNGQLVELTDILKIS